jgi:hypothetical protein
MGMTNNEIWPKYLLLLEGVSFGVKCYKFNDQVSTPIALGVDMKPLILSSDPIVRHMQKGEPYYKHDLPDKRSLWQWFDAGSIEQWLGRKQRTHVKSTQKTPTERLILLD